MLNTVTGPVLGLFLQHKEHWKKSYGTSWTSVTVLTGRQVLGFCTSGKHLAKWSTIYYNASIDLQIQLNTIGLLQHLFGFKVHANCEQLQSLGIMYISQHSNPLVQFDISWNLSTH